MACFSRVLRMLPHPHRSFIDEKCIPVRWVLIEVEVDGPMLPFPCNVVSIPPHELNVFFVCSRFTATLNSMPYMIAPGY